MQTDFLKAHVESMRVQQHIIETTSNKINYILQFWATKTFVTDLKVWLTIRFCLCNAEFPNVAYPKERRWFGFRSTEYCVLLIYLLYSMTCRLIRKPSSLVSIPPFKLALYSGAPGRVRCLLLTIFSRFSIWRSTSCNNLPAFFLCLRVYWGNEASILCAAAAITQ